MEHVQARCGRHDQRAQFTPCVGQDAPRDTIPAARRPGHHRHQRRQERAAAAFTVNPRANLRPSSQLRGQHRQQRCPRSAPVGAP